MNKRAEWMDGRQKVCESGFGAWFARISVQRPAGKIGVSPSPPRRVQARYKVLKNNGLRVFQTGRMRGHLVTGTRLAEMGNSWANLPAKWDLADDHFGGTSSI
jgi:hypothetical protein